MNKTLTSWLSVVVVFLCLPLHAWNGSGTYEDPYEIATLADLQDLQTAVNGGASQSGIYFLQTADIDLSSVPSWNGIGTISSDLSTTNAFSGDYDGDGYSVSGMTIYVSGLGDNQGSKYYGLFHSINNATLANIVVQGKIVVKGSFSSGTEITIGSVCASVYGNCLIEGVESYTDIYYENLNATDTNGALAIIGGVLGKAQINNSTTWLALKNYGNIVSVSPYRVSVSGVLGWYGCPNGQVREFRGWENHGKICSVSSSSQNATSTSLASVSVSGIVFFNNPWATVLRTCQNYGDITITGGCWSASGVYNCMNNGTSRGYARSCLNEGNIYLRSGDGRIQGFCGIVGGNADRGSSFVSASTNAGNIYVEGTINGNYQISGILSLSTGSVSVGIGSEHCVNKGNLSYVGTNTNGEERVSVGGIFVPSVGQNYNSFSSNGCVNYGDVFVSSVNGGVADTKLFVGGIGVSYAFRGGNKNAICNNCSNFGKVSLYTADNFEGTAIASGLVSAHSSTRNMVKVNWCYNLGQMVYGGKNINVGGLMGEMTTADADQFNHLDHSYSACSIRGEGTNCYVGSIVGLAVKTSTSPTTISNTFGVVINQNVSAFGQFVGAYTNNVKGYAWEEVYRDLNISGFYLPSSKFNQPSKTATFFDLICPMNTEIFPTDTDEAKRLHNAVLVNGYKRYVRTIQQQ